MGMKCVAKIAASLLVGMGAGYSLSGTREMTLDEAVAARGDILTPSQRSLVAAVLRRYGYRVGRALEVLAVDTPYAADSIHALAEHFSDVELHLLSQPRTPR